MLNNKTILITGGTGAFGRKFVDSVLRDYPNIKKLIIYSRNEQQQYIMSKQYAHEKFPQLRFFIGDIRDLNRLIRACEDVDILIHAASITNVNTAEYNPDECIKTNILGAQNIIEAALHTNIKNIISLSSDKACAPTTLYGATKLTSDKLFCAANNLGGIKDIKFSVVRFPNVLGGNGSAYAIFRDAIENGDGFIPITDFQMTRFNISLVEAVKVVLYAINNQIGGEIFVPKCLSYRLIDLATAMAPNMLQKEIGLRTNEKKHEELISLCDAPDTIDIGNYYAIIPSISFKYTRETMLAKHGNHFVNKDFHYSSDKNTSWETVDSLRAKIRRYIDNKFIIQ